MSWIKELTFKQERRLEEYRDQWISYGLSTEPANKPMAEDAVLEIYDRTGLARPKIVWCQSPLELYYAKEQEGLAWHPDKSVSNYPLHPGLHRKIEEAWWKWRIAGYDVEFKGAATSLASRYRREIQKCWDNVGLIINRQAILWEESCFEGQFMAGQYFSRGWIPDVLGSDLGIAPYKDAFARVAKSAGFWYPVRNTCYICDRPESIKMEATRHTTIIGRLHNTDGPAVKYRDGWGVYSIHGVIFHQDTFTQPIKLDRIVHEGNVEARRLLIEMYGHGNYLRDMKAQRLHRDDWGTLWSLADSVLGQLVMVEVVNSTPEMDGTFKNYFLRVDPRCKTAKEAIASTFGLLEEEYNPQIQA